MLTRLTTDCAHLLDVASAGLVLGDQRGVLHVMAASSDHARELELFQIQRLEGPCQDCYRSGAPVSAPDLSGSGRWPRFARAAERHGFSSVHAVPMRLRTRTLGALGLFGTRPGRLNAEDLNLAQALADVASVALVQHDTGVDSPSVSLQLQTALNARVVVEQAKGLLAYSGRTSPQAAFQLLRSYAGEHQQQLSTVAGWVVHGDLPARVVLEHASARPERDDEGGSGGEGGPAAARG
nr:GAF and ANTAR domain-containing protein [Kineococcus vitellinus]